MSEAYVSPFRLQKEEYERDIDIVSAYITQTAEFIRVNEQLPKDKLPELKSAVMEMISNGGSLEHKFPNVRVFVRDVNTGDRFEKNVPIDKLFQSVIKKELISTPALTFYLPEKVKRSMLSIFTEQNVKKRGVIKEAMFEAERQKDEVLRIYKKNEQNAVKTQNNGLSGALSSPYTILHMQSGHSVLTGMCRTATSNGNSANERFFAGTRHYSCPADVIRHILSINHLTDWDTVERCMSTYNLHYPTVEETLEVIKHSTSLYYINEEGDKFIAEFVGKLTDLERAGFVYAGDLYHLAKFNDGFVRNFIKTLITPVDVSIPEDFDYDAVAKTFDGDMRIVLTQLNPTLPDISPKIRDIKNRETYEAVVKHGYMLQKTISKYTLLIRAILTNKNVPSRIASMPDAIRRVGLVSDTDSTMMCAQRWAIWYCGNYHSEEATMVSDLVIYLSVQHLSHLMANMSSNMGVSKERIFLYAMKNEFKFGSFMLTTKAKHYLALITSQEGNLKSDPELEVKGVSLRTSNIPAAVMKKFKRRVKKMCKQVAAGQEIDIHEILDEVAFLENQVAESIIQGKPDYLKSTNIKERSAYDENRESNYHYHRLYNSTMSGRYGWLEEPPYEAYKLPVRLRNKTLINEWIETIEDEIIKNGFKEWFKENKRDYKQFILPDYLVSNYGIPKDLVKAADIRKACFATVEPYYHVLECLGIYMIDENRTLLVSDYYGDKTVSEVA